MERRKTTLVELASVAASSCVRFLARRGLKTGHVEGTFFSQDDALVALYQSELTEPLLLAMYLDHGEVWCAFFSRGHAVCSPMDGDIDDIAFRAACVLGFQLIRGGELDDELRVINARLTAPAA